MGTPLSATLSLVVWAGLVFLPIGMAVWCWRTASRRTTRWPFHLLLAPALVLTEWGLVRLLFYATGDDGDGPPGLGFALLPGFVTFLGSLLGYYGRLAVVELAKLRSHSAS